MTPADMQVMSRHLCKQEIRPTRNIRFLHLVLADAEGAAQLDARGAGFPRCGVKAPPWPLGRFIRHAAGSGGALAQASSQLRVCQQAGDLRQPARECFAHAPHRIRQLGRLLCPEAL